ncbi:MAG: hypothetical protein PHW82_00230 [Bacteroidales bacterium]|nr:hypothetical protein [Bacteroidales bacterium]
MKRVLILLLLVVTIDGFSQQIIRGYTASFSYGFLSKGDDFTIHYSGKDYTATARETNGSCLGLGFPFDVGYKRSRFVFTPGLEFVSSNYELDLDKGMLNTSTNSDSLRLSSFMITPKLELIYKFHFYIKSVHFAIGGGIDLRLPLSNNIILTTKDKADLIEYDATSNSTTDFLTFKPKTVFSNLANLGFHVSPKITFDIYMARFLTTSIFYTASPLTTYTDNPVLRGYGGIGISYLVPMGKKDDSRVLQYYKQ